MQQTKPCVKTSSLGARTSRPPAVGMRPSRHKHLFSTLAATLCLSPLLAMAAATGTVQLISSADGWQAEFDAATTTLTCRQPSSGAVVKGRLSFSTIVSGKRVAWTVQPSRDYAPKRLAIVDTKNDAQGYISLGGNSARLVLSVLHRPPQNYEGELVFEPEIRLGTDAFACRTDVPSGGSVIQMASGAADSLLNDSVFDPDKDCVLRFSGKSVVLKTEKQASFKARLTARPGDATGGVISMETLPDYYRSRYVPMYHRIDRKRCPTPPTGWMSWNTYFDTAGEKENLDEAKVGAKYLKPFGCDIWSIESWQENSPKLPVSVFYNITLEASKTKFPHGMKWLAEQIRALGFRPGIWTVPFGTGDAKYYAEHKDWFLHKPDGSPMQNWCGKFLLDPSQPAVRKQMEDSHRTMSADWGYEFFKIDGMSGRGPGYSAHFYERPEVRAAFKGKDMDPYPLCIEALRKGIGEDRILLACQGHYTGPEVAWSDAARMGADIVHPNQPPHWANYYNQAKVTVNQLFTHNIVWYIDADTLLVGEAPLGMARLATTVIGLPGQLTFFGDKLAQLPPERMRLLQQVLPVCDVRPLDLAPINTTKPVWDLKIRRPFANWDVVSVFNWQTNAAQTIKVDFTEMGLPAGKEYLVYEFWSKKFLGVHRDGLEINVEPQANVLLAVHERQAHPQLLSTDRHVSQGGVEWTSCSWDASRGELSCGFKLVANDTLTALIHVPKGYTFNKATADGATVKGVSQNTPPVIAVKIQRDSNGEAKLVASFKK